MIAQARPAAQTRPAADDDAAAAAGHPPAAVARAGTAGADPRSARKQRHARVARTTPAPKPTKRRSSLSPNPPTPPARDQRQPSERATGMPEPTEAEHRSTSEAGWATRRSRAHRKRRGRGRRSHAGILRLARRDARRITCCGSWNCRAHRAAKIGASARAIIDAINDDGYLTEPLEEIARNLRPELKSTAAEVERVLEHVQAMDPAASARARQRMHRSCSCASWIRIRPGRNRACNWPTGHLDQVAEQQYALLKRQLRVTDEELEHALALVRACQPRPGSAIHSVRRPSTSCRTCSCAAPNGLGGRDQSRDACRASA